MSSLTFMPLCPRLCHCMPWYAVPLPGYAMPLPWYAIVCLGTPCHCLGTTCHCLGTLCHCLGTLCHCLGTSCHCLGTLCHCLGTPCQIHLFQQVMSFALDFYCYDILFIDICIKCLKSLYAPDTVVVQTVLFCS